MIENTARLSLKYSQNVPKDYHISQMQYTFDFIYLVYKRDASIDGAIKGVAREYSLSKDYLLDYLVENKYLMNKTDKYELSELLKSYNTKALKKILKKHGLKTSGKRQRIEERILKNNLIGNSYYLSSKSKVFYKNKKRRMDIFTDYLFDHYYFDEFNEFYMDNYRKKEERIPVEFIRLHINKSAEDKNHDSFILNNLIMAEHFSKKEKYTKMLEYVLVNYCMDLNPIWKINDLKKHEGINSSTYDNILFLKDKLSKNTIISAYFVVWDSFNFERIIVPKYEGYRCLKDLLNLKDPSKISDDLDKKFYKNDDLKIKRITQKTLFDF
ncbi:MAG: SAP domain-containing protein [Methanobrevibacter sp.]|uniref:SAP domain-containing protein n=1 Tax=Methanobrevibacter sp. TaxID=66852 RepID=UPI0025D28EB3|nr:SAP domain-containing protein [Methanobrevibacter sp.]MBR0271718.1 SAP domain-containing protein [Methanobrevibacter sp.]